MKEVVLTFPDIVSLTDFVLVHKVSHAEVDTNNRRLTATLSEKEIITANTEYGAVSRKTIDFFE
jgi:hypothetical protein